MMECITANNIEEFLNKLKAIDIKVPPRANGRSTKHCEIWSVCRLLSTLANIGELSFPLQLTHDDRPDFILEMGERKIGIETTEAVNQQYAWASTFPEARNNFIDVSHFKYGTPKRIKKELLSIVSQDQNTGPGWEGDSVEREYADIITDSINSKIKKLRNEEFNKFGKNWLSIFFNYTLPCLEFDEANNLLRQKLFSYWESESVFSDVFVEIYQRIIWYSSDRTEILTINNLWKTDQ